MADHETVQARWLLTSKQMMLEGLAQFHRHSIWIFGSGCKTERSASIFPLITPALVHEQHLYVGGTRDDWTDNNVGWLDSKGPNTGCGSSDMRTICRKALQSAHHNHTALDG
jgi:hypothetical protein